MVVSTNFSQVRHIALIVSDVDGVLTNGTVTIHSDGSESKQFTVEDGAAVALARVASIPIALLSARYSEATTIRAREMRIDYCYQGRLDKLAAFQEICGIYNLPEERVCYIGDGLVDIPVLEVSGLAVAPENAHPLVKDIAHIVTARSGGRGVILETIEFILQQQERFEAVCKQMRQEIYQA